MIIIIIIMILLKHYNNYYYNNDNKCIYIYYIYLYSHPQTDLFRSIGTHQSG